MEIKILKFNELDNLTLYEIIKQRIDIFVVEQNCPYHELDDIDINAIHFILCEDNKILAYLRVFESDGVAHIGRVIATVRKKGYSTMLLKEAISYIKKQYNKDIYIEAQVYCMNLYKGVGFKEYGETYLLDNIPHIKMKYEMNS